MRRFIGAAAWLALTACGPSQLSFTADWAEGWCELAVDCPLPSNSNYDLSSKEACRTDAIQTYESTSCDYDAELGEELLERLETATCDEFLADTGALHIFRAFDCSGGPQPLTEPQL